MPGVVRYGSDVEHFKIIDNVQNAIINVSQSGLNFTDPLVENMQAAIEHH